MAKDPAILFYYQDFMYGTRRFSREQRGLYIELICEQADSKTGSIPVEDFKEITNCDCAAPVIRKFEQDNNGFYNKILRYRMDKRRKYTESRRKNLKGGRKKNTSMTPHKEIHMEPHMENEIENENRNVIKNRNEKIVFPFESPEFLRWWALWKEYKHKEFKFKYASATSEQAALKKLSQLSNGEEATALKIIEQSMAEGWKGLFKIKDSQAGSIDMDNYKKELIERSTR